MMNYHLSYFFLLKKWTYFKPPIHHRERSMYKAEEHFKSCLMKNIQYYLPLDLLGMSVSWVIKDRTCAYSWRWTCFCISTRRGLWRLIPRWYHVYLHLFMDWKTLNLSSLKGSYKLSFRLPLLNFGNLCNSCLFFILF